ncbi:MAG: type II toxin-antitoxin system RelE/ParE family toxin [Kineosporiaceae bacterium]
MSYGIVLRPAARRALTETLPEAVAAAALEFLAGALSEAPHRVGKRLLAPQDHLHSARRGEYRVLYRIDDDRQIVVVETVRHRRDAYHT